VYQAKRERRRSNEVQLGQGCAEFRLLCQSWDSLWIENDGLLIITLPASAQYPQRKRLVCPAAIRQELIEVTHPLTHAGVQEVRDKLQLRWYWPKMGGDMRRRVEWCKVSQANKHDHPPVEAGRQDARQAGTVNLTKSTPPLWKPERQTTMRRQQRRGPECAVVTPWEKGLARDERLPPPERE